IKVLECLTHDDFGCYIRWLGPNFARGVPGPDVSKRRRLNSLIDLFDADPSQLIEGRLLSEALVEKAASLFPPEPCYPSEERPLTSAMEAFQRMLGVDGFAVDDQAIRRSLPADVGLP